MRRLVAVLAAAPLLIAASPGKVRVRPPIPQIQYFDFKPGSRYVFSERRRKFLKEEWENGGDSLKLEVLDASKDANATFNLLAETVSGTNEIVRDQFFLRVKLTPSEVEFKKDVPVTIAKLPLSVGEKAGEFEVKTFQGSLETSTATFRHCLQINGFTESFVFAPYVGLVQWKLQDREWTLKELRLNSYQPMALDRKEREQIEKLAKDFCKRYQVGFERLLSVGAVSGDLGQASCRFLITMEDAQIPGGRKYEVQEKTYLRQNFGTEVLWGEP